MDVTRDIERDDDRKTLVDDRDVLQSERKLGDVLMNVKRTDLRRREKRLVILCRFRLDDQKCELWRQR